MHREAQLAEADRARQHLSVVASAWAACELRAAVGEEQREACVGTPALRAGARGNACDGVPALLAGLWGEQSRASSELQAALLRQRAFFTRELVDEGRQELAVERVRGEGAYRHGAVRGRCRAGGLDVH